MRPNHKESDHPNLNGKAIAPAAPKGQQPPINDVHSEHNGKAILQAAPKGQQPPINDVHLEHNGKAILQAAPKGAAVSILIVNKNYAEYLGEAIDSVLAQDMDGIELIVVDDGSSDYSRDVIESYGDQLISVFGDFGGQIAATNVAWQRCTGDVVLMLDSDDKLRPSAVSMYLAQLENSQYIKVSGYLRVVDSQGNSLDTTIPRRLTPSGDHRQRLISGGPGAYRAAFNSGNAWKRSFLEEVMPIPETVKLGPDGYLNLICPLFGATASIDDWVAEYRIHGRNLGPVSRRFTVPWLQRILNQLEASSIYLNEWIVRTGGPMNAMQRWQKSWRFLLVRHCLQRMTGKDQYRISPVKLILSPFESVGTRTRLAVFLSPMLAAVVCLPRSLSMSMAGRLLGFGKSKE